MAFDFPASPTEGQLYQAPGGPLYSFKAPVWNVVLNDQTPAGTIIMTARATAPAGFLKANGALVSRTVYVDLFAAIGTLYGAGDGVTTFAVPDLRGEFPRFWDDAKGVDPGRLMGSAQTDGVKSHTHVIDIAATGTISASHQHAISFNTGGRSAAHTHVASGTTGGDSVSHTHTFSDASSATGTGSANHAHNVNIYGGTGSDTILPAMSGDNILQGAAAGVATSSGAAHTHTVATSGTTGGRSVSHTHSFSDTTTSESVDHSHLVSGNTGSQNTNHTHTVDGTTNANTSATTENRPRNVALLACIKY
jgi:microcystin-dependent protein